MQPLNKEPNFCEASPTEVSFNLPLNMMSKTTEFCGLQNRKEFDLELGSSPKTGKHQLTADIKRLSLSNQQFDSKVSKLNFKSSIIRNPNENPNAKHFRDLTIRHILPRLKIFRILRNRIDPSIKECSSPEVFSFFADCTVRPQKKAVTFDLREMGGSARSFYQLAKDKEEEPKLIKGSYMVGLRDWFYKIDGNRGQKDADWGVFSPSGYIVFFLNLVFVLLMAFLAVGLPIIYCFKTERPIFITNLIFGAKAFLLIDQLALLNTGFYQYGRPVMRRRIILRHIFIHNKVKEIVFAVSLIFGISTTFHDEEWRYLLNIPLAIKIKEAMDRQAKVQEFIELNSTMIQVLWVVKLMMLLVYFGHLCACIWFMIGYYEKEADYISWLANTYMEGDELVHKYITSYYWAVMTMSTVGYGDIIPVTSLERGFSVLVMLMSSLLFAYTVSSIGGVLSRIEEETVESRRKQAIFSTYLKKKRIPKELKGRVQQYVQYALEQSNLVKREEKGMFELLPAHLKKEVLVEINGGLMAGSQHFLCQIFSEQFILKITESMSENFYMPQDFILSKKDKANRSMFIIQSGEYRIILAKSHETIAIKNV